MQPVVCCDVLACSTCHASYPPPTTYVWIVVPLVLTPDLILLPTALHCLQLCAVKLLVAGSSGRAGAVVAQRVGGGSGGAAGGRGLSAAPHHTLMGQRGVVWRGGELGRAGLLLSWQAGRQAGPLHSWHGVPVPVRRLMQTDV